MLRPYRIFAITGKMSNEFYTKNPHELSFAKAKQPTSNNPKNLICKALKISSDKSQPYEMTGQIRCVEMRNVASGKWLYSIARFNLTAQANSGHTIIASKCHVKKCNT